MPCMLSNDDFNLIIAWFALETGQTKMRRKLYDRIRMSLYFKLIKNVQLKKPFLFSVNR